VGRQYVGIDLHKHRSVIVTMDEAGKVSSTVRIDNDPVALAAEVAKAGEQPEVVLEATVGWYWAADVLEEMGATVHLAHPNGLNWGYRRVKNDRDATDLADMLRMGRLPEAWLVPPKQRELRELVRYRARLVQMRTALKSQVQSVLTKQGVTKTRRNLWGAKADEHFAELGLDATFEDKVASLRILIAAFDEEID
jgi:transposase